MYKFCTKCGCALNEDYLCPNCDKGLLKKQSEIDINVPKPINFTESSANTKSHKMTKKSKRKITIIFVCMVLAALVIGGLVWLFGSLFTEQNDAKTQDEYMMEYAEYVTINEYIIETNEFGEKVAVAEVRCPDYKSIYNDIFKKINPDDDATDTEINAEFFGEVSKHLKDDYKTITMEIAVNLSEKDYEKTENDSWSDDEITELLKQRAAIQAFEEFCIERIMEYAPEIAEEGLLGDVK